MDRQMGESTNGKDLCVTCYRHQRAHTHRRGTYKIKIVYIKISVVLKKIRKYCQHSAQFLQGNNQLKLSCSCYYISCSQQPYDCPLTTVPNAGEPLIGKAMENEKLAREEENRAE